MFARFLLRPERLTRQAQIKADVGVIRPKLQRLPKVSQPLVETLLLPADHSQQKENLAIGRFGLNDLPIQRFGLTELPGLMQLAGSPQCFRDCPHDEYSAVSPAIDQRTSRDRTIVMRAGGP